MFFRLALILVFIIQSACFSGAQNILVRDSCTDNTSSFNKQNDSTYFVHSHYNGRLVFSGNVINPDTTTIFLGLLSENNFDFSYEGLCIFNDNHGRPWRKINFENGKRKEVWEYKGTDLISYAKETKEITFNKIYTLGNLIEETIADHQKGLYTTIIYNGKKMIITKEKLNKTTGAYGPADRVTIYYNRSDLTVKEKVIKFSKGDHVQYRQYYDKGRLYQVDEYNRKGELIRQAYYDPKGHISNQTNIETKKDRDNKLIYLLKTHQSFGPGHKGYKDTLVLFVKDKVERSVIHLTPSFIHTYDKYKVKYQWHDTSISIYKKYFSENGSTVELYYAGYNKASHIRYFNNGEFVHSTLINYNSAVPRPLFDDYLNPERFADHFPDFYTWWSYSLGEYESSFKNESEYKGLIVTDTSFQNGKPSFLHTYHNETLKRYAFTRSGLKLLFNSGDYRIAKDLNACGEGIKGPNNRWVVPAEYTLITEFDEDTNTVYFAEKDEFTTVFNWKGELLIPPTRGIKSPQKGARLDDLEGLFRWVPREIHHGVIQDVKEDRILIVNDDKAGKYYFLRLDNQVVLSNMPGRIHLTDYRPNQLGFPYFPEFNYYDSTGHIGFFNLAGLSLPPIYTYIQHLNNGYFIVKTGFNETFKLLDPTCKETFIPVFNSYEMMNDSALMTFDKAGHPSIYEIKDKPLLTHSADFTINYLHKNGYFVINKNGREGICDFSLKVIIPPNYRNVRQSNYGFAARIKDTTEFYSSRGELYNRLVCDSLYDYYYYYVGNSYHQSGSNSVLSYQPLLYRDNGKFGLVNSFGKIIVSAQYDMIGETGNGYLLISKGEILKVVDYESDSIKTIDIFPRNGVMSFSNMASKPINDYYNIHYNNNCLLDAYGKIIGWGLDLHTKGHGRTDLTEVFSHGHFMGTINSLGEWVFRSSNFNNSLMLGKGNMYVRNNQGLSGICNCKGKYIIQPQSQYIFYDEKNQLLWYNIIEVNSSYANRESYNGIWTVKKLTTGKVYSDTLYHPINFIDKYCIVQDKKKNYGVLDTALNQVIPFLFTEYNYDPHYYFFTHPGKQIWIADFNFKIVKKLKLDRMIRITDNSYMGYKDTICYYLDSNFNYIDSSARFFCSMPDIIPSIYDEIYEQEELQEVSMDEYSEEYVKPVSKIPVRVKNFIISLEAYYQSISYSHNFQNSIVFPPPVTHDNDRYDFRNINLFRFNTFGTYLLTTMPTGYRPPVFNLYSVNNYPALIFNSTGGNAVSYYYRTDYREPAEFMTFYVDSLSGVFQVPLVDLISTEKHSGFVSLIRKQLAMLEDTEIPCFSPEDYMEFFEKRFVVTNDGFKFFLDSGYSVDVPLAELKTIMASYWKERF